MQMYGKFEGLPRNIVPCSGIMTPDKALDDSADFQLKFIFIFSVEELVLKDLPQVLKDLPNNSCLVLSSCLWDVPCIQNSQTKGQPVLFNLDFRKVCLFHYLPTNENPSKINHGIESKNWITIYQLLPSDLLITQMEVT